MSIPLPSTKFYIPKPRTGGVPRPRLSQRILDGLGTSSTLLLISCPAGFGKTTLLSQVVEELGKPVAWVSLDPADNDPIRFWTALITGLQSVHPGMAASVLEMLQLPGPVPEGAIPTMLINELADLPDDLVLILDDYHAIHEASLHAALSSIIDRLPARLHIVVSTRMDPPLPLARLRARNQLLELRAADLRFTLEETKAFLHDCMRLELTPEQAELLETRTEGWAASLQLAGVSMQGSPDLPAFLRAFSGSHGYVAEYLLEEVLKSQPPRLQDFLLQTSILEQLSPEICQAVTGDADAPSLLAALQQKNLFLIPLDDEGRSFRYHHLFADLLRARCNRAYPPDAVTALHGRASAWYQVQNMPDQAISHAFSAGDIPSAVDLVEKAALPMVLGAHVRTVEAWLGSIPADQLERSPRLNMAFAWIHLLRAAPPQALPYIQRLEPMMAAVDEQANPSLAAEWLAIRSRLLLEQGQPREARQLAKRGIGMVPEGDMHVRSMLYTDQAMACQALLDYQGAAQAFTLLVQEARATGNFTLETIGLSGRARMLLQQGELQLACSTAAEGVARLEEAGRMTPFGATLFGELGQVHYYWHKLDEARRWFERSVRTSGHSGYSDPEIFLHIVSSRMYQMEGDWDSASLELAKATRIAQALPPAMVREELVSQQVILHLAFGRLPEAQATLEPDGFSFGGGFKFPHLQAGSGVTHQLGLLYDSAFRILLARFRLKPNRLSLQVGLELSVDVLAGELQSHHLPVAMQTMLLRSQMHASLGENRLALQDVLGAVQLALPQGFISPFVEEGPAVLAGLRLLQGMGGLDPAVSAFVAVLIAAFPSTNFSSPEPAPEPSTQSVSVPADEQPIEPLTRRELEVLELIAQGDSNQAIADKLVISLSAVKKHTTNIFHKLNVSSRTKALARARSLGLLPTPHS